MIIAVSDVHLGYNKCNKLAFNSFLDKCVSRPEVNYLVLLGDILEIWRRNNVSVALENEDIFMKLQSLNTQVHYIVGNHDYLMLKWYQSFPEDYPFRVSKFLRLQDDNSEFYFMHGYELEVLTNLEPLTIEAYEKTSEALCQLTEAFFGSVLSTLWETLRMQIKRWIEEERRLNQ